MSAAGITEMVARKWLATVFEHMDQPGIGDVLKDETLRHIGDAKAVAGGCQAPRRVVKDELPLAAQASDAQMPHRHEVTKKSQ